ncbi:MAG: hypothetical protein JJ992_03960, partial [Planctomycetes bacterium]|nr:hypothetical protein [Planctomycetota bacterium]
QRATEDIDLGHLRGGIAVAQRSLSGKCRYRRSLPCNPDCDGTASFPAPRWGRGPSPRGGV